MPNKVRLACVNSDLKVSNEFAARFTLWDSDDFIDDDVAELSGTTTLIGCNCGTIIISIIIILMYCGMQYGVQNCNV